MWAVLISCPECSKQVSSLASSCPHCGNPSLEQWKSVGEELIDCPRCNGTGTTKNPERPQYGPYSCGYCKGRKKVKAIVEEEAGTKVKRYSSGWGTDNPLAEKQAFETTGRFLTDPWAEDKAYKEVNNLDCSISRDETSGVGVRGSWGCLPGCLGIIVGALAFYYFGLSWFPAVIAAILAGFGLDQLYVVTHRREVAWANASKEELQARRTKFRELRQLYEKTYGKEYSPIAKSLK